MTTTLTPDLLTLTGLLTVAPWIDATRSRAVVTLARIGGTWERDGAARLLPALTLASTSLRPRTDGLLSNLWAPLTDETLLATLAARGEAPPQLVAAALPLDGDTLADALPALGQSTTAHSDALGLTVLRDRWGDDLCLDTALDPQGQARSPHGLGALCWRRDRVALVMLQGAAWLWLLHAAAAVLQRPRAAPPQPQRGVWAALSANQAQEAQALAEWSVPVTVLVLDGRPVKALEQTRRA